MNRSEQARIVIVGAGPAGLTAAYAAVRRGARPIVYEKTGLVGGHARTEQFRGFRFDIGGHRFFTKVDEIQRIWASLLGERFLKVQRLSRIHFEGRFFHYPLRLGDVVAGLGLGETFRVAASYLRAVMLPRRNENDFESWVINRFGERLYGKFFKSYTEKVWGIPCDRIRAEWAAQRIKGLTLPSVLRNAVTGSRGVKSLIGEFQYPQLGPGMMWEAMSADVVEHGGEVHLNHEVTQLRLANNRVRAVKVVGPDGERAVEGDHFVSSMPIPMLVGRMHPAPPADVLAAAEGLDFRDFMTVCLIVDHPDLFPDNWIYIHEPTVRMGRLQNFKNWSRHMVPDSRKTGLGAEYFCTAGDDLWQMDDDDLVRLASSELDALGLTRGAKVELGVVYRQRNAYPIYDEHCAARMEVLERYFRGLENLHTVGRNGLHRYNNQDHSMLTALLAVDNAMGADHDLWGVNADHEYHEIDAGEGLDSWAESLIDAATSD